MSDSQAKPEAAKPVLLEEGAELMLDFNKLTRVSGGRPGVLPVAVQNVETGELILVAYTNETAFRKCMSSRKLFLWSTSRNELWEKGRTSGETFDVVEAFVNCEQNSLLYKVRPNRGGICPTMNSKGKARNCFYRRINMESLRLENLDP